MKQIHIESPCPQKNTCSIQRTNKLVEILHTKVWQRIIYFKTSPAQSSKTDNFKYLQRSYSKIVEQIVNLIPKKLVLELTFGYGKKI